MGSFLTAESTESAFALPFVTLVCSNFCRKDFFPATLILWTWKGVVLFDETEEGGVSSCLVGVENDVSSSDDASEGVGDGEDSMAILGRL